MWTVTEVWWVKNYAWVVFVQVILADIKIFIGIFGLHQSSLKPCANFSSVGTLILILSQSSAITHQSRDSVRHLVFIHETLVHAECIEELRCISI